MKIRLFCIIILLSSIVLALNGCGSTPGERGGGTSEKSLVLAVSSDVNNWDLVRFPDGDARFAWSQIYETLVRLDTELNEVPGLATSWEPSEGGKVWTFKLRQGIKFHDGTPFTAAAVFYSYGERADVVKRKVMPLVSVEALDDYTVRFLLSRPAPLPSYLTHVAWPVMSPTSLDGQGQFKGPVGTGPYKLEKHDRDQQIALVRFDDYWGQKATLDKVIFKVVKDASTRLMALQSGQIDMALKLNETDAARLADSPDIKIYRKLSTFTDFIQFNTKKPPFDDVNVRRAVALAVDSEKIVRELLSNIGVPAMGRPLSPVMKYSDPNLKMSPDPAKARDLLARAGWLDGDDDGILEKDGKTLTVTAKLAPWSPRQKIEAEAFQGQLRAAGIDMKVQVMEQGAIDTAEKAGDFDILLRTGYFTWGDYPHHLKIHTSKNMYSHWANEEYDRLIAEGESALDEAAKNEAYRRAQQLILDQVPAYYTVHEEKVVAARNSVKGYKITAEDPWLNLAGVTIEK